MADATARAETAQAFFCAIADYVGVANMPDPLKKVKKYKCKGTEYDDVADYKAFKQYYACVLSPRGWKIEQIFTKMVRANASLKEVETLLDDRDWYLSSIRIAVALLNQLGKISTKLAGKGIGSKDAQDIIYWRAAPGGVMKTIDDLYKAANKAAKLWNQNNPNAKTKKTDFNDTNKWSPADIYWATEKSKKVFETALTTVKENKTYSFGELNELICEEIQKGELLPLSLKKNAKETIKIVPVNFVRANETKAVENLVAGDLKPGWGTNAWTEYKGKKITGCIGKPDKKDMRGGERELVLGKLGEGQRRDVILYINKRTGKTGAGTATGQYIKFRHDPSGSGAWKCQIFEKTGPAAGALGQTGVGIQMNLAGGDNKGTTWANGYNSANKVFLNAVRSTAVIYPDGRGGKMSMKAMGDCKALRKADEKKAVEDYMDADPKLSASAAAKKLPKNEIAARYAVHLANLSGQLVANVSCAALVKWLSEGRKTGRTDMFVRNCYLFATSRTESSARFVIGK
jgi:hypothetical protein